MLRKAVLLLREALPFCIGKLVGCSLCIFENLKKTKSKIRINNNIGKNRNVCSYNIKPEITENQKPVLHICTKLNMSATFFFFNRLITKSKV